MTRPFALAALILGLSVSTSWAVVPVSHQATFHGAKHTKVVKKPRVQQHYSFIPPPTPILGLAKLQQTAAFRIF